MQRWKPKSAPGLWIGITILVIMLAGALFLGVRLTTSVARPPEQWAVDLFLYGELVGFLVLTIIAGFLAYQLASVLTMAYEIDRNGLYIRWLGNRAIIPLDAIELLDSGAPGAQMPFPFLQGVGYYWGEGRTSDYKPLHLFSTIPPDQALILHTASACYALSPDDQDGFVQDLEQRRRLGAVKPVAATHEYGRLIFYAFWNDPVIRWCVLLTVVFNLLLLGIVAARYPDLASTVEMRFNAAGEAVELRPRHQVLFLPLAAIGLGVLNAGIGMALYRWEQTGARVLQVASVVLPILFGVAVTTIIAR